jgi:hypothetical protein
MDLNEGSRVDDPSSLPQLNSSSSMRMSNADVKKAACSQSPFFSTSLIAGFDLGRLLDLHNLEKYSNLAAAILWSRFSPATGNLEGVRRVRQRKDEHEKSEQVCAN